MSHDTHRGSRSDCCRVLTELAEAMCFAETAHDTLVIADAMRHARLQWASVIAEGERFLQEQNTGACQAERVSR